MNSSTLSFLRPTLAGALLAGSVADSAQAQLFMDVGDVFLSPNQAGQQVEFFIENLGAVGISVSGLSFNLQVAGGGPASEGGPGPNFADGPNITGVDLLSGSTFALNNTGPQNAASIDQFANWTITTSSGFASLGAGVRSKLATVTFDTTGFSSGAWALSLGDTLNGPTKYFRIDGPQVNEIVPQITDGTLTVGTAPVPEPAATALVSAIAILGLAAWRRVQRSQAGQRSFTVHPQDHLFRSSAGTGHAQGRAVDYIRFSDSTLKTSASDTPASPLREWRDR